MSRGWIIGIVCLAISGYSLRNGWAQEGRPQAAASQSFSQRLAALRNVFQREKKTAAAPQNRSRKPRSQASAIPNPSSTSARANRTAIDTRSSRSRAASSSSRPGHHKAGTALVASKKRIGSAKRSPANARQGRYPSASRGTTDLGSALSDLLSTGTSQPARDAQVAIAEDSTPTVKKKTDKKKTAQKKTTRRSKTAQRGTFDVYRALVGDTETNSPTAEVAEAPSKSQAATGNKAKSTRKPEAVAESKKRNARPTVTRPQTAETQTAETLPVATEPEQTAIGHNQPTTKYREAHQHPETKSRTTAQESVSTNPMRNGPRGQSSASVEPSVRVQQDGQLAGELLLSSTQPVIESHVEGPRRIMVGREATYHVILENTGDTKARSVVATIRIPEWTEIVEVTSTNGAVKRRDAGDNKGLLGWQLQELAARSSAKLRLRLIPHSGRPMQIGVQWSQAPATSETMVEVQEPKLEVSLSGPQEVLFGQPQRYRLVLRNPGTGVAEKVMVQLIPPGGDKQSATTQTIGPLQAGEVREIELELTAREAGELIMQASAVAEGGLTAETIKKVLCRRPELQVDWRGPETKYAGTVSTYFLRVQNPGTATTEPVAVTFELPKGSQFVSASEGYTVGKTGKTVSWRLAGLGVDEAQFMQVRCRIDQPGINRFSVTAQVDNGDLSDTKTIETNIVALADLKLEVSDPQGPLPLGDSALYEIRVRNRGKTAAKGVSIVGLFSTGIDPVSVEGAQYSERDGRVIFHPIKSLPAGKEIVLRIRAKAMQAGTHVFRAEVNCQDLGIKLAAEETTRFFEEDSRGEESRWEDSRTPYSAKNDETVSR